MGGNNGPIKGGNNGPNVGSSIRLVERERRVYTIRGKSKLPVKSKNKIQANSHSPRIATIETTLEIAIELAASNPPN